LTEGVVVAAQTQDARLEELDPDDVSVVHQTLRREVNERVRTLAPGFDGGRPETIDIVCECSYTECSGRVTMAVSDYESVRRFPTRFIVKAAHYVSELERVVADSDEYIVVEKIGGAGAYAVRADPRRRQKVTAAGAS
jgi:hypothetical protein